MPLPPPLPLQDTGALSRPRPDNFSGSTFELGSCHSGQLGFRAASGTQPGRLVCATSSFRVSSVGCPYPPIIGPGSRVAAASPDSSPCSGPRLESPPGLFLDVGTYPWQSRLGLEGRGRLKKPVARPEASLGPKPPRWELKPQRGRQCTPQKEASQV